MSNLIHYEIKEFDIYILLKYINIHETSPPWNQLVLLHKSSHEFRIPI